MKKLICILMATSLALASTLADASIKAGPRKGRLLELDGKNAEFFVEPNRKVSIAFYSPEGKPLPLSGESCTAVAEAPSGKAKLEFEAKDALLISKDPLPEGDGYQVVVQLKSSPEAKQQNFRIKLETYICKGCSNPEYACVCVE